MFRLNSQPSGCSATVTIVAASLLGIGVVMVFSANASLSSSPSSADILHNATFRQGVCAVVALVVLLVTCLWPYEWWRLRRDTVFQPAVFLMVLAIGLLAAVLVFGEERNGARRWLSLGIAGGGLSFQPSEVAKLAIVVFCAALCGRLGIRIRWFWRGLLPTVLALGLVVGLVGKEDLGTGVLLMAVCAWMLVAAGAKIWHLGIFSLPALGGVVYLICVARFRIDRLLAFLDPYADPQGAGYHPIQSMITIASGGWWGRGLGAGIQKYGYLPEGRSDFIFSVICEELGLIGGVAIIGLFVVLMWAGRRAMLSAASDFGRLLALGATLILGFQAVMNIGVVTVSLPTKGISLPLVSAGGTGVIFLSILVGLMANVARRRHKEPRRNNVSG